MASLLYLPKHIWGTITLDGAGETRAGAGGRGKAYSFTSWKSWSGAVVDEKTIYYHTAEDAREDFADELKGGGTIIANDGGTIVRLLGDPQTKSGAAEVITLKDREIHYVKSVSLRHISDFEESWIKLW